MTMTTIELQMFRGIRVRVGNERGYYWVWSTRPDDDTVTVFGGSKDPNGVRRMRSVKASDLRPDTRTLELKAYPATLRGE